ESCEPATRRFGIRNYALALEELDGLHVCCARLVGPTCQLENLAECAGRLRPLQVPVGWLDDLHRLLRQLLSLRKPAPTREDPGAYRPPAELRIEVVLHCELGSPTRGLVRLVVATLPIERFGQHREGGRQKANLTQPLEVLHPLACRGLGVIEAPCANRLVGLAHSRRRPKQLVA